MLKVLSEPLAEAHDLVMFDLDGVVYIESAAVPGAPEQLARLRGGSTKLAFITKCMMMVNA